MLTANLSKSKPDYWLILASLMLIPFYLLVFYPLTQAGFFCDEYFQLSAFGNTQTRG